MLLKRLKLLALTDIFTTALFILSLINLLENDLFNSIMLILIGMVGLTVNYNLRQLQRRINNGTTI